MIRDDRIAKFIEEDLDAKSQWPDPWLSLNPFFADGGSVEDLADRRPAAPGVRADLPDRQDRGRHVLRRHSRSASTGTSGTPSRPPATGDSYVLTTGTGSGKSLAYIVPIVDRVLRARAAGDRPSGSGRSSSTR